MSETIQLPQIAIDCPYIADLFDPSRLADQLEIYSKDPRSQSLAIFLDWKKVLDGEMSNEEFDELHKMSDL